jgi:uncharacterized membrane protein
MTFKQMIPQSLRGYWHSDASDEPAGKAPLTAAGLSCVSMAVGAALTFIFDPTSGRRRRKVLTDKLISGARSLACAVDVTARDLANRVRGLFAMVRPGSSDDAPDYVIEDRVRSRLGRVCSHPRALSVLSDMGNVIVSGPILEDEVDGVLKTISNTPGVCSIVNYLDVHDAADIPKLQGGRRPPAMIRRDNWSPATRFLTGAAGVGAMTYCLSKRTIPAILVGSAGFALFLRATTNLPARRLVGIGSGRRGIDVQKTINIRAPIEVVYAFWSKSENFPLFMTNVKEVRDRGDGTSHWVVSGPAGATMEWDACITDYQPNQLIAWKSAPGSTIASAGNVRFDRNPDDTTHVSVRLSYNPPAGAIGHALASHFGADPKTLIDQDLLRMKTLIEIGHFPHDAAQHMTASGTVTSSR